MNLKKNPLQHLLLVAMLINLALVNANAQTNTTEQDNNTNVETRLQQYKIAIDARSKSNEYDKQVSNIQSPKGITVSTPDYLANKAGRIDGFVYNAHTLQPLKNVKVTITTISGKEHVEYSDRHGTFYAGSTLKVKSIKFTGSGLKAHIIDISGKRLPLFIGLDSYYSRGNPTQLKNETSFLLPEEILSMSSVFNKTILSDKGAEIYRADNCRDYSSVYGLGSENMVYTEYKDAKQEDEYGKYKTHYRNDYEYEQMLSKVFPDYKDIFKIYTKSKTKWYSSAGAGSSKYIHKLNICSYILPETFSVRSGYQNLLKLEQLAPYYENEMYCYEYRAKNYGNDTEDKKRIESSKYQIDRYLDRARKICSLRGNDILYLHCLNHELLKVERKRYQLLRNENSLANGYLKNKSYPETYILSDKIESPGKKKRADKFGHVHKSYPLVPQIPEGDFELTFEADNAKSYAESKQQFISILFIGKHNKKFPEQKELFIELKEGQLTDNSTIKVVVKDQVVSVYLNTTKLEERSFDVGTSLDQIEQIIIKGNKLQISEITNTTLITQRNRDYFINTTIAENRRKLEAQMVYFRSIIEEVLNVVDITDIFYEFKNTKNKPLEEKVAFINKYPYFEKASGYKDVFAYNIINSKTHTTSEKVNMLENNNLLYLQRHSKYAFIKQFLEEAKSETVNETIAKIKQIQYAEGSFAKKMEMLEELRKKQRNIYDDYDAGTSLKGNIYQTFTKIVDEEVNYIKNKHGNLIVQAKEIQKLRDDSFVKKNNYRDDYICGYVQRLAKQKITLDYDIEYISSTYSVPAREEHEIIETYELFEGKKYEIETTYYPAYENTDITNYRIMGSIRNNNIVPISVRVTTCYSYLGFLLAKTRDCESTYKDLAPGQTVSFKINNTYNGTSDISVYYEVSKFDGVYVK